jgi:hypothetical protein
MPRVTHFASVAMFSLVLLAAGASAVSAQKLPMLRVIQDTAPVRTRPTFFSEIVKTAGKGTMLDVVDMQDDWYWVILPADENGTRYPGWIRRHDVEIVSFGDASSTLRHLSESVEEAKQRDAAQAAEEQARLDQAKEKLEEARREYEALTRKSAEPAQPAPTTPPKRPAPVKTESVAKPLSIKPAPSGTPRYEWFGGYSFFRDQSDSVSFPGGWAISAGRQWTDAIDLVGEISGSHRSDAIFGAAPATSNVYTFAAGPKYARQTSGVNSFGQVLIGLSRTTATALGVSNSSTGLALQPGVGVDIAVAKSIAVRVRGDLAVLRSGGVWIGGFRFSTGLMLVTGGAR